MLTTIRITESELRNAVKEVIAEQIQKASSIQPLRTWNGYVVLRHDSNERIKNGVINAAGRQRNNYSKNSDAANYFWASEKAGRDPSNVSAFRYYCLVKPELIYDIETNPKGYKSVSEALKSEAYVSGRWNDGAVAVMSNHQTPISYIEELPSSGNVGGIYDSKWHMLRSKGVYYNKQRNMELAKKMKAWKNVEVPDFLGGYTYDQVISAKAY